MRAGSAGSSKMSADTATDGSANGNKLQRRSTIPEKPNYSLNLWSIMKNCVGRDLSKIPMPVSCHSILYYQSVCHNIHHTVTIFIILSQYSSCCHSVHHTAAVSQYSSCYHRVAVSMLVDTYTRTVCSSVLMSHVPFKYS